MTESRTVFHLAIPCRDLDEAAEFYGQRLDCRLARRYEDRITVDFFGDQLVCHLAPDRIDATPEMYPRHFGATFRSLEEFETLVTLADQRGLPFYKRPFVRFPGQPAEHRTFFLCDPSNNLIEFKYYKDPAMIY